MLSLHECLCAPGLRAPQSGHSSDPNDRIMGLVMTVQHPDPMGWESHDNHLKCTTLTGLHHTPMLSGDLEWYQQMK